MREAPFKIRATQVDTLGHLNNAAYLEIFEWARWEWAAAEDMDIEAMIAERRIGPAVLHVDLSFFRELKMHESITVRTWVHSLERVRGVVAQEMIKADGEVAARLYLTFAMFHLDKRLPVGLPEELKAIFDADADHRRQRERDAQGKPKAGKYRRSRD